MIHNVLSLESQINKYYTEVGIDSIEKCTDIEHFQNYKKHVDYRLNSRGFRDTEWPENLENCIFAVGDSYTVGIAQPFAETWPQLLQDISGYKIINISLSGASNSWILRKCNYIIDNIKPKYVIPHWSFLHRDEKPDQSLNDEARQMHFADNKKYILDTKRMLMDFIDTKLLDKQINKTKIINSFISAEVAYASIPFLIDDNDTKILLPWTNQLDYARDYVHYDIKTSYEIANRLNEYID